MDPDVGNLCFWFERVTEFGSIGKPGGYIGLCNNKSYIGGCGAADLGAVGVGTPRRGVRASKMTDGSASRPYLGTEQPAARARLADRNPANGAWGMSRD